MFSLIQLSGMSVYLWQSSLITTVIRKVISWHILKLFIDGGVELLLIGLNPEKDGSLG